MTKLPSSLLSSSAAVLEESLEGIQLPENFNDLALARGVKEDSLPEVRARSVRIISHSRRDAVDTFLFGDDLVFVQGQMRDEKAFAEFATETFRYDGKYIAKFMRISLELAPHRNRCINLAMKSTLLIEMLPRTPQERNEILAKLEEGERVTTKQIKDWGKQEETPIDPLTQPGRKGLLALGQSNLKTGMSIFTMLVGKILARIEAELQQEKGRKPKAIQKGKLNEDVRRDARIASGHLVRLVCGLQSGTFGDTEPVALPEGSEWRKVQDLVQRLGRGDSEWPSRGELRSWLANDAVPTLRFALGDGEALKVGERPTAAVAADETGEAEGVGEIELELAPDEAAIAIVAKPEEVETAAEPKAPVVKAAEPKRELPKAPAVKKPKKSPAVPTSAAEIFDAAVEAASNQDFLS